MEEDASALFGSDSLPDEANFFVDVLGNDMSIDWMPISIMADTLPPGSLSQEPDKIPCPGTSTESLDGAPGLRDTWDVRIISNDPGPGNVVLEPLPASDIQASMARPTQLTPHVYPMPLPTDVAELVPEAVPPGHVTCGNQSVGGTTFAVCSPPEVVSGFAPNETTLNASGTPVKSVPSTIEGSVEMSYRAAGVESNELVRLVASETSLHEPLSISLDMDVQDKGTELLSSSSLHNKTNSTAELPESVVESVVEEIIKDLVDTICMNHTVLSNQASFDAARLGAQSLSPAFQDTSLSLPARDQAAPLYRDSPDEHGGCVLQSPVRGRNGGTGATDEGAAITTPVPSEVPIKEELLLVGSEELSDASTSWPAPAQPITTCVAPLSPDPSPVPAPCSPSATPEPEHWVARQKALVVEMPSATLVSPPSGYEPFIPPAPEMPEWKVVDALCRESRRLGLNKKDHTEFKLSDFAVYIDTAHYPQEMRSLHHLDTRPGHSKYYFDGCLSVGDIPHFVRRVPIAALPIEGYLDSDQHTVRDSIWLQSAHNARRQLYYKLGQPAKEYERFHKPFYWVADLSKHFVDYLDDMHERGKGVSIQNFTHDFSVWILRRHGAVPELVEWAKQHPSGDFRTSVAAHIGFLYKEACGVLEARKVEFHPVWNETMRFTHFKREPVTNLTHDPTIVTDYIRDCFSHLAFGDRLESIPLSQQTKDLRRRLIRKRRLEMPAPLHDSAAVLSTDARRPVRNIQPGDTISTLRDDADSGTQWKREVSMGSLDVDRWFARVLKVSRNRKGQRLFDVIWYYRPADTLCGLMKYPWSNELFLSDHCSCGEASKITEDQVLGIHDVELWGMSATKKELFCRQTYISGDRKWITLKKKHLYCEHVADEKECDDEEGYRAGDTVLVHLNNRSERSEPCEIVDIEHHSKQVRLRRLLRRKNADSSAVSAPLNELVWSDEVVCTKRSRILSRCHVRFFRQGATIPTPYGRDGVGSFFFITHRYVGDGICTPLQEQPPSLRQGFDPYQDLGGRLRGLDLFCGGGNFGRGLEDGGAIEMRWLNDYNEQAIHTYMANVANPEAVHPFLGSIDDMQRQAMLGNFSEKVPKIGDVDFISAGSPCPGFSNLTNDKTTAQQRKNQSLVAAFGSFVDLYRPRYGLLENVRGIVQQKANRDQDVFSQLICAVVGLGYQTRFFFLDASSCGSPQARPRVFLAFAAPGCRLPNRPQITHSHPPSTKGLSLGLLPNGEPMAEREMPVATPFKFVSASEACDDLPVIYDAKPDTCIAYPDHRVAVGTTRDLYRQMSAIPTQPWAMNFALAWYGMDRKRAGSGVLTRAERELFPADIGQRSIGRTLPNSGAYGRLPPNRPFNTIITRISPGDAKNGQQIHWREPRAITLMEARRAQGFRDHEVLLGSVRDQYRIVGNSVAREVAVALGLMFREAEFGSLTDGEEDLSRLMDVGMTDEMEEAVLDDFDNDIGDLSQLQAMESTRGPLSASTASQRSETLTTVKRPRSQFVVEIPVSKRPRPGVRQPSSLRPVLDLLTDDKLGCS